MSNRLYCRLGFVLLCVAPTLATASAVAWRRGADTFVGSKGTWEASLSAKLGFQVSLAKVSRPNAGTTLLEKVELADRETGKLVARARLIEAAQTEHGLVLVVSQPEILVDELGSLAGTFHESLLRVPEFATSVHLVAGEVTLRAPRQAQTYATVDCLLETLENGPRATLRFRLPGATDGEPAQLQVTRSRESSPPSTRWELNTGSTPLSCSLLAAYVRPLEMLGDDCEFHGVVWGQHSATGWEGDARGRLSKVNLDRLITNQFPHKLSGMADVTLHRARFEAGRLVDASGSLDSQGGVIGRALTLASAESLGLKPAPRLAAVKRWPHRYERLAVGFTQTESGLSLSGNCDDEGTLLEDGEGPLIVCPAKHSVPSVALVRALVPHSEVQVPATAETEGLLAALPIPRLARSKGSASRPSSSRVKLKE